jgi:hypothetical protein
MVRFLQRNFPRTRIRVTYAGDSRPWEMRKTANDTVFLRVRIEGSRAKDFLSEGIDAMEILEKFENIRTEKNALDFLESTYCGWDFAGDICRFSDVRKLKEFFRDASLQPFADWIKLEGLYPWEWVEELQKSPALHLVWRRLAQDEAAFPVLECKLGLFSSEANLQTLFGTVLQIEQSQGLGRNVCQRSDCSRTFLENSRSDKRYCSPNCANVERRRELHRRDTSK